MTPILCTEPDQAVAGITDGSTVLIGGFGMAGMPVEPIDALIRTVLAAFFARPRTENSVLLPAAIRFLGFRPALPGRGDRAGTRPARQPGQADARHRSRNRCLLHSSGCRYSAGRKQGTREINGRTHVLHCPIHGEVALIKAHRADLGNLIYRKTARDFGPVMATATTTVIGQVGEVGEIGELDPEDIVRQGVYVDGLVAARTAHWTSARSERFCPATFPPGPRQNSASANPPLWPTT